MEPHKSFSFSKSENEIKELLRTQTSTILQQKVEEDVEQAVVPINPVILDNKELMWVTLRTGPVVSLMKNRFFSKNAYRIILKT